MATVELASPRRLSRVGLDCLEAQGAWIFPPRSVEVSTSLDGERWTAAGAVEADADPRSDRRVRRLEVRLSARETRFVRVHARPHLLPEWHPGAGEGAWIFVDEIVIEEG